MPLFYELSMTDYDGWHIFMPKDTPNVEIWKLDRCSRIDGIEAVDFEIHVEGKRVDYNFSSFGTTVVSKRMGDLLDSLAARDIQRIPAVVNGERGQWDVLNVTTCLDCIDHARSKITYYPPSHPRHAGTPRGVLKLVLDPSLCIGHDVFHPVGWEVTTIVSERVKVALESMGATGVGFRQVTG